MQSVDEFANFGEAPRVLAERKGSLEFPFVCLDDLGDRDTKRGNHITDGPPAVQSVEDVSRVGQRLQEGVLLLQVPGLQR